MHISVLLSQSSTSVEDICTIWYKHQPMCHFAELLPWSPSPCLTLIVLLGFFTSSSWERKQKPLWQLNLTVVKPTEKRTDLLLNSDNKQLMPTEDSSYPLEKGDRQTEKVAMAIALAILLSSLHEMNP